MSFCTQLTIQEYFQDGDLPPEGTVCDMDMEIFFQSSSDKGASLEARLSEKHKKVFRAVRELAKRQRVGLLRF